MMSLTCKGTSTSDDVKGYVAKTLGNRFISGINHTERLLYSESQTKNINLTDKRPFQLWSSKLYIIKFYL